MPGIIHTAIFIATTCLVSVSSAASGDWGTLKGRFVFDGQTPEATVLQVTRDEEVCGQHNLVDESLIVNSKNGGIQNVVVWLHSKTEVPIHPSLNALPKPAQLDNKDCRFTPRVVRLRTNQLLQCVNSDSVAHNVAVYARRNQPFSIVVPQNEPLERQFNRSELLPVRIDCSIHAWMRAYLVITDHPYSAVSDKDGNFVIENLPQGNWDFRIWHERSGYIKTLHAKTTHELNRGTLSLTIESVTDLGDLKTKAADLDDAK